MARLQINRKITVWSVEHIEYDDTKYTEEEFVKLYHEQIHGADSYVSMNANKDSLYDTHDYEILQYSAEDLTPEENYNNPTLEILNEKGVIYDNLKKV
tara:strand:+ start:137 stop:430 length:294 start_codon:yes stop_codon:yes gene_type:complete